MRPAPALTLAIVLGLTLAPEAAGDDRPAAPIEVYEWSVWVGSPAQMTLNAPSVYRNPMPAAVGTIRPKFEGAELDRKFAIAPLSVLQAFGDPTRDVDFDLRIKKGLLLSDWPRGAERPGRLQWFKSSLSAAVPAGFTVGYLPEDHPLAAFRKVDPALYLKYENRVERFLAYDLEIQAPIPVKIRGGPDGYTLQNLTGQPLLDVAVVAPVDGGGYRVGWLDSLPTAVPPASAAAEEVKAAESKAIDRAKETPAAKANAAAALFDEADREKNKPQTKAADKPPEAKPMPAEGDANLRARVDQVLNRPVTLDPGQVSRKDALAVISGQSRFRYELDDPTLAKAEIDLAKPMELKGGQVAARDALAEVLGPVGLSYRVTEDGSLFVTTAARLADESGKKGAVIEGPPVTLTLGPASRPCDPSHRESARAAYARRLAARGMRPEVVRAYLDRTASDLFEPKGLIVLAHLSRDAIDEIAPLDIFPPPTKFIRTALVVSQGVDPRLQDRARGLVKALGDPSYPAREAAETALFDLGPVAVPALEDALKDRDIEVVLRVERLLMRLNRPVP